MILAPNAVQQYFDDNNNFLVGGLLFLYAADSTTKQAAFTDASGATALPNPIVLNARGEVAPSGTGASCGLWLDPTLSYKMVLAPPTAGDPPTATFWTVDNIVSPQTAILAALAQYEATVGGVPIGMTTAFGGATAPNGWLLCYGQAVSRTAYALLFAIIGTAFGIGDGSSTFNLPDLRGRLPLGADNMGGSPANRVTQAVSGINSQVVGAGGGDQRAQTDTLTATTTVTVIDPGHAHGLTNLWNQTEGAGSNVNAFGAGEIQLATATNTATTGLSVTAETSVTSGNAGSSQNMPPVQVVNWIIYTAVSS